MNALSIGKRNAKIGRVPSFSLPSFASCPVTTPWCRRWCYARKYERRRSACQSAYTRNLALALDPARFVPAMLEALPPRLPCMRLHVSGDFFSPAYADAWTLICRSRPQTRFWAYTRAWLAPDIAPALERLRALPNVEIFASVDPDMPLPPPGWRVAYLAEDARAQGAPCREQNGSADSCRACGYCYAQHAGDVVFSRH